MATRHEGPGLTFWAFTVNTVIVVYVIVDVEYPRCGLIRLASADNGLVELRSDMK
jgi:hypothetical protein